jgi:hypothetical protein
MKAKLALVVASIAVLAVVGVGCGKVTGGGWFYDEQLGDKVTVTANAQQTSDVTEWLPDMVGLVGKADAKGEFQLVDHVTKTNIHGTFTGTYAGSLADNFATEEPVFGAVYWGICSVNGGADEPFWVEFFCDTDFNPEDGVGPIDYVRISIGPAEYPDIGENVMYSGEIKGGNMMVHKAQK